MNAPVTRHFIPSGLCPVGNGLWVTDQLGAAWAHVDGDPPRIQAVHDIGRALGGLFRLPGGMVAAGDHVWVPSPEGLIAVNRDGSVDASVDIGGWGGLMAATPGAVWTTTRLPSRPAVQGTVARLELESREVTHFEIGGKIKHIAGAAEGLWIFRSDDETLVLVDADRGDIVHQVQLDGYLHALAIGASTVLMVLCLRPGDRHQTYGLAQVDRRSGALVRITARPTAPVGMVVVGDDAWIGVDPHAQLPPLTVETVELHKRFVETAVSVVDRVDLRTGQTIATASVPGQLLGLAGGPERVWARMARDRGGRIEVLAAVDSATGAMGSTLDFWDLDLSDFSSPPRPRLRPLGIPPPRERPTPKTVEEAERRLLAEARRQIFDPIQWNGNGERVYRKRRDPATAEILFEPVRLKGSFPDTRIQFIFRVRSVGSFRIGWERPVWPCHTAELPRSYANSGHGLEGPEEVASDLRLALSETVFSLGGWLPERPDPDEEGITWAVSPYGGRSAFDWTFRDKVENALRRVRHKRPYPREAVEALLDSGVDSYEALVELVTTDREDEAAAVALWLLTQWRKAAPVEPLLAQLRATDGGQRLRAARKLTQLAAREHGEQLLRAYERERDDAVRMELLRALTAVGTERAHDPARDVLEDRSAPTQLREVAATALGSSTSGQLEDVALLISTLDDPVPEVVAAAAQALRRCAPRRTAHHTEAIAARPDQPDS